MTASVVAGPAIRALTRTPTQSQQDFRLLIDVLCRPGTVRALELAARPDVPAAAVVAAGLADVEVSLAVLEDGERWAAALHSATGASTAPLATAQLVVALRTPMAPEILALARGDALHPELGSRLVIAVSALGEPDAPVTLHLRGPGVVDENELRISGIPADVLEALSLANAEFPAGVDTFLVAADGRVAALPRSSRIRIETCEKPSTEGSGTEGEH